MPLQEDIIRKLRGKRYISTVDAKSFFHQFLVWREHRDRFTVVSQRGMERSKVALMGFKNSPAHAQRFMDETLRDHAEYAAAFIDDIIIFSETMEEHIRHLTIIFELFHERNITLSPSKSFLAYPSVKLLGYLVDGIGLTNTEERLAALRRMKFPETLQHLEKMDWHGLTCFRP